MPTAPALPLVDRLEFAPPTRTRSWGAFVFALAAHVLLVVALTWGVNWKNSDEAAAFSAELWTGQPQQQQAAVQPQPPVPPEPTPAPPPPAPAPAPRVEPATPDVDIALEQEKKRALLRKQQAAEDAAEQRAAELAERKQAKLKEEQARLKAEQAAENAADRAEAAKLKAQQVAQEAKAAAKDAQRKQDQQKQVAAAAKAQRDANLARLNAQLGSVGGNAGGGGNPRGTAAQGSGSSSTYGAIIKAAVKPNVVFTDEVVGNPTAKVEVRLTLDGTIISQRLVSSSGNKAWDDAAMNGITRTRVMPRDVDGRIPDTTLILEMRPKN